MTFRAAPLIGGFASLVLGIGLIGLFDPRNRFISYAQVSAGSLAITAGLYLILVVSWHELGDADPRRPRLYSLVRREARGRLLRTTASGGALAVLVGILLSTMFITNGAAYSVSSTKDKLGADMLVVPRETTLSAQPFYTLSYAGGVGNNGSAGPQFSIPPYLDGNVTREVSSLPGVKQATPQLLLSFFLPSGGCGGLDVTYIVGVDQRKNNFVLESWLPGNVSASLGGDGAIAGAEVPDFYQLPAGAQFYGVQLVRESVLPRTGTFMDHVIFISMDTANRMLTWQEAGGDFSRYGMSALQFKPGQVSAVFVKLDDGVNPTTEAAAVSSQVAGVKAYTLDSLAKAASLQYSGLLSIFTFSGGLVWVGSLALVATVASLATNERKGEIGVMRTLGASKGFVRRLVASQTMLTTSLAGLIGILAVWVSFNSPVVYDSVILAFRMPYVPPSPSVAASFVALAAVVVVVTSGVGALLASRVSGRVEAYDAVRQGAR
ncbi:MAG TPA: FtsX-like permease family protein [Nitrososphaerales archaeon]|nr:FtsX-like permease family protein [Nitrososphaerales archaeon]